MRRFKSSRSTVIGLAVVALISTAVVPSPVGAVTNSTLGSVSFTSGSTSLTATAKQTLGSFKTKIASKDTVTVTGYIRNHSGQTGAVALARATAVKNYLVSIGVTAKIKTVNGGVPRVGGSSASAEKATIIKQSAAVAKKGTFKSAVWLHYDMPDHASSHCPSLTVKVTYKPKGSGTLTNITSKKGVIRTGNIYYCDFTINQSVPVGVYDVTITMTGTDVATFYDESLTNPFTIEKVGTNTLKATGLDPVTIENSKTVNYVELSLIWGNQY